MGNGVGSLFNNAHHLTRLLQGRVLLFSLNSPSLAQVLAYRTDRTCMSKRESGIRTFQDKGIAGTKARSLCVCVETSDWNTGK